MTKRSKLALSMALILVAGLSCNELTAPPTTGGIDIVFTSSPGGNLMVVPRETTEPNVDLSIVSPNPLNVLLDGVRVTVSGPTDKSVTVTTASGGFFQVTVDGLDPGTYTVIVEGLVGGLVGHYGEATGVVVTAGNTTSAPITFPMFQPVLPNPTLTDTVEVLRFTVSYGAVPNADSYVVAWSTSPTMSGAQTRSVTTTSTEITVPAEGKYYFTVRAVSNDAQATGLPSVPKSVQVFQSVVSVVVTPSSPSITAGQTVQFSFEARDGDNVIVANPPVVWISNNHNVATISPTGLATTITSGTATITAAAKGTPGVTTLTATPMAASKLVFTQQPGNTTAGVAMAELKVAIQNVQNQTNTNDDVTQITITIANNAGGGTLGGTATATVVDGVATFSTLNINKTGTGYTLTAAPTTGTLTSATSTAFNITAAGADRLAFIIPPANITAGAPISPAVQVEVRDALGNRVVGSSAPVTLGIGTNPSSGTLSGTKTVNAINGVASFSGLSVDKVGTGYTLTAMSGSLTAALPSSAFNVNVGPASKVGFTMSPNTVTSDDFVQVTVTTQDALGNQVATTHDIAMAIGNNPCGGVLTGSTTVQASNGIANFNDLKIDKACEGYTLVATSAVLVSSQASNPFGITVGAPARFTFKTAPADGEPLNALSTIEVALVDDAGNQTAIDGVNVALALADNPGAATLSGGNPVATVGGVATFTNVSIDNAATGYRLATSNADGFSDEASGSFDVFLDFIQVAAGFVHSCGLTSRGTAYCWGENFSGQLGDGLGVQSLVPSLVAGGHQFTQIAVGYQHNCGLRIDGEAFCWGLNSWGEVGDGSTGVLKPTPVLVSGGHQWSSLAIGLIHTCGVRTDGAAFCWGNNQAGMIGDGGPNTDKNVPTAVVGGHLFTQLSGGHTHTCGIRTDGAAYCWGQQANGRLGNGSNIVGTFSTPQAVAGGHTFLSITGGTNHSCAIRAPSTDRRALCWGTNPTGQLGVGDQIEKTSPTLVAGGYRYAQLGAGNLHTCGIALSGDALCWGSANNGRLGNGDAADDATGGPYLSPVFVVGGNKFTFISGNRWTEGVACGVTESATFCWGINGSGQLGDGTTFQSAIPQPVKGSR